MKQKTLSDNTLYTKYTQTSICGYEKHSDTGIILNSEQKWTKYKK